MNLLRFFILPPCVDNQVRSLAVQAQDFCVDLLPTSSRWPELYAATVCGVNLSVQAEANQLFRESGLIHLLVVSGSHLVLLLRPVRRWPNLALVVGFLYTIFTGLQAPCLRAWWQMLWGQYLFSQKIQVSASVLGLLSVLSTLLCFPHMAASWSLPLSSVASLALNSANTTVSNWQSCLRVYVFLFPLMTALSPPHPLSVLCNAVLAGLLGLLLFPACLSTLLTSILCPLVDLIWDLILFVLEQLSPFLQTSAPLLQDSVLLRWVYVVGLHAWSHHNEVLRMRRSLQCGS